MSQELFQQILSDLKKCQPTDKPYAILDSIKSVVPPLVEVALCEFCTYSDVIKVMESGIFHNGALKGKEPSSKNDSIISYPIKDLPLFILRATSILCMPGLEEIFQDSISAFDKVIKKMDSLKFAARAYRSKSSLNRLEKIEQDLKDIKSHLLGKPQRKLGFKLPKDLRNKLDCIAKFISLFKEQIPLSKIYNTAGAIHTLLRLSDKFDNDITQEAIAQRMYRMD